MLTRREVFAMELQHRAISVYLYLCDRADKDGKCFPSVRTISEDINLSVRTVQRAIRDLEEAGLLRTEERTRLNGGRSSTLYFLK